MTARQKINTRGATARTWKTTATIPLLMAAILLAATLIAMTLAAPASARTVDTGETVVPPQIEVCFVLDTTGSMSGLIEGAKTKIWSIANQMIAAEPTPRLRIGLIGYRDRGDDYITRVSDLDDDIDAVYADLQGFGAGGGGDLPESVQQALHEAVTEISWSASGDVLKIIFLVGDCPPHLDYKQDVPYQDTCQDAVRKDLIINTVQCGDVAETTPIWQDIAALAEGSFVAIGQSGDMQIVAAPQDKRLAELNIALGKTLVAYGNREMQEEVAAKQRRAESAPMGASADRLAFNRKVGKTVQGKGDLVDDIAAGDADLSDLDEGELPEAMQGMTLAEQEAYLAAQQEARQTIQAEIDALLQERGAYIAAELKAAAAAGAKTGFDAEISEMISRQAEKKGIQYDLP